MTLIYFVKNICYVTTIIVIIAMLCFKTKKTIVVHFLNFL